MLEWLKKKTKTPLYFPRINLQIIWTAGVVANHPRSGGKNDFC